MDIRALMDQNITLTSENTISKSEISRLSMNNQHLK